jgi:hypothetical protein
MSGGKELWHITENIGRAIGAGPRRLSFLITNNPPASNVLGNIVLATSLLCQDKSARNTWNFKTLRALVHELTCSPGFGPKPCDFGRKKGKESINVLRERGGVEEVADDS